MVLERSRFRISTCVLRLDPGLGGIRVHTLRQVRIRNIDGKVEYEILNTLQEMGMARLAYKIKQID